MGFTIGDNGGYAAATGGSGGGVSVCISLGKRGSSITSNVGGGKGGYGSCYLYGGVSGWTGGSGTSITGTTVTGDFVET